MRIGLVLEVTTICYYGKHGIEIRIWSVGQENSQSWVRIYYGTNKYVIDSNHNCKEYISPQKNGYENCIYSTNNIYMSNEDNNHDTNYINKFHDANHDARKLHM